ncbi:MAG: hypothetical protein V3S42_04575 [Candidatus Neomarinimicrobiota bacterium]
MTTFTICPEIGGCSIPVFELHKKTYGCCECDQGIAIFEVDLKDCFGDSKPEKI